MRKTLTALLFIGSGFLLSSCTVGHSASYVRGWNSNLDGASNCSGSVPGVTQSAQFEEGCKAASQQWLNTFEDSTGPSGGGTGLTIYPGNPKYKIAPIN
jgi:hypothetical protein